METAPSSFRDPATESRLIDMQLDVVRRDFERRLEAARRDSERELETRVRDLEHRRFMERLQLDHEIKMLGIKLDSAVYTCPHTRARARRVQAGFPTTFTGFSPAQNVVLVVWWTVVMAIWVVVLAIR